MLDNIRQRDIVCRITIISGYAMDVNGGYTAIVVFNKMQDLRVKLGTISLVGHYIFLTGLLHEGY